MPLFELFRMAKEKLDSSQQKNPSSSTDLSIEAENDFVELIWENGQILKQGQSSRAKKSPTSNSLPSYCLPSHTPKIRDKDKFETANSMLNEIQMPGPSGQMGSNQDDEMVPWLNYGLDESLQRDYCSDFLHELSGVTGNELPSQSNFASVDKRSSCNPFNRDFNTISGNLNGSLGHGNISKLSAIEGGEATRPRSSTSPLYASTSQQCQTSFPNLRSRASDSTDNGLKNSADHGFRGSEPTSFGSLPGLKMQRPDQRLSGGNPGVMNFSHFARPVALVRANLQNIASMPGAGLSRIDRMRGKDKTSVASCSPVSQVIDSRAYLRKEAISNCQPVAETSKVAEKPEENKTSEQPASEPPEAICQEDALSKDKMPIKVHAESATKGAVDSEKTVEPVVAASSVCSANSEERASDDRPHNLKRKYCDPEDSEYPSEEQDVEEESTGGKKPGPGRVGTGSKRSRAAEVHNLSERRRRDRINEKMRALQELIPNCNKVDKASMLDEAIEYLKTLQLQVQIMSMGAGFYMPQMMYPSGMQPMHPAHMAHFSPMGIAMGMGSGYRMGMPEVNHGSSCYPMVQVPGMHGAHFPGASVSGPTTLQGMAGSNFQLFGLPGQGLPNSMPHAPLNPLSGGPVMNPAMGQTTSGIVGPIDIMDAAAGSTSKAPVPNVNSQVMQNTGANTSVNQTSSQCHATNEGFAQPSVIQDNCQAPEVQDIDSTIKNEDDSNKAVCYD